MSEKLFKAVAVLTSVVIAAALTAGPSQASRAATEAELAHAIGGVGGLCPNTKCGTPYNACPEQNCPPYSQGCDAWDQLRNKDQISQMLTGNDVTHNVKLYECDDTQCVVKGALGYYWCGPGTLVNPSHPHMSCAE